MSKNNRRVASIDLICNVCGNVNPIKRLIGRRRKAGHIKHIYCYICKDVVEHTDTNSDLLHNMQDLSVYR